MSLKAKVNYAEIQCEDAQRDLDIVKKENARLKDERDQIAQTNEVVGMIHKFQEDSKNDHLNEITKRRSALNTNCMWAQKVRKTESVERQAMIFYESYRAAIVQEDDF